MDARLHEDLDRTALFCSRNQVIGREMDARLHEDLDSGEWRSSPDKRMDARLLEDRDVIQDTMVRYTS
jgi:hypothetical protein